MSRVGANAFEHFRRAALRSQFIAMPARYEIADLAHIAFPLAGRSSASQFESLLPTDAVEKLFFRRPAKILRAVRLRIEKRFGGNAEVEVQAASDHRSCIAIALSTDFCS
jgi:hypothetical protein